MNIDYDVPVTRRMARKAAKLRALATLANSSDTLYRLGHALATVGNEQDAYTLQTMADRITLAIDTMEVPDLKLT